NEIYVDPNLIGKVVIGEEGMSVIVYSFTDDRFEIRDKVSSDYAIVLTPIHNIEHISVVRPTNQ
ncbi:hypothetical protein ACSLOS_31505, partial [Klebsiella pneumoniae]